MKCIILALSLLLPASTALGQDLSPEAAARAYTPSQPPPRCIPKAGPIAGVTVSPVLFLGGALMAGAGSVEPLGSQGSYDRREKALRGTGFAMMGLGLAGTIASAIYMHRARHPVSTCRKEKP